ncbi:hypothetical protein CKY47_31190 [Saccharothrix yanglingensis]|uniref:Uncharacterized protein n=1 Tax=Saccharothrix yanglingensis TaxID=659496 RepID=A0ABU0X8A1_9PSEU|nr:hypothetical protein [Saccharothrix yanglingensis]
MVRLRGGVVVAFRRLEHQVQPVAVQHAVHVLHQPGEPVLLPERRRHQEHPPAPRAQRRHRDTATPVANARGATHSAAVGLSSPLRSSATPPATAGPRNATAPTGTVPPVSGHGRAFCWWMIRTSRPARTTELPEDAPAT